MVGLGERLKSEIVMPVLVLKKRQRLPLPEKWRRSAIWVTERLVWLSRSFIALTAARSINSSAVIPVPSATIAERYLGDMSSSWAKVIA